MTYNDPITGEVIELPDSNPDEIMESWLLVKKAKDELDKTQKQLRQMVLEKDLDKYESGNYMFTISQTQRMSYDKGLLREAMPDEDMRDMFLKPDKGAIDKWIAERVKNNEADETIAQLRENMIAEGKPYITVKAIKVSRSNNG